MATDFRDANTRWAPVAPLEALRLAPPERPSHREHHVRPTVEVPRSIWRRFRVTEIDEDLVGAISKHRRRFVEWNLGEESCAI